MSDYEQVGRDDEAWSVIHNCLLDKSGEDMPVWEEWENRIVFPEYNLPDYGVSLLARLGMPLVPTAAVIQPGKELKASFKNYRVELFGIRGQLRSGRRAEQPDEVFEIDESNFIAPAYGVWEFPITHQNEERWFTLSIHIWRMRLFARGVESCVEQLWNTYEGRWLRVILNMRTGHETDIQIDMANLKKLADGLPLFNLVLQAASPRRQKVVSLDNFKREAYQAIEILSRQPQRRGKKGKRRGRRVLAVEPLANKIGCGKQTIYDYTKEEPDLWNHFNDLFELLKSDRTLTLDDALNRLKPS